MFKKSALLATCLFVFLALPLLSSCAHARPPKPGPDFVWVEPHHAPNGTFIEGYWKYTGPAKPGNNWVPGHRAPNGKWVPGYWKAVPRAKRGGAWVPGHYGPKGKWIPGHWR